jgi:hypothetical protein
MNPECKTYCSVTWLLLDYQLAKTWSVQLRTELPRFHSSNQTDLWNCFNNKDITILSREYSIVITEVNMYLLFM